MALEYLQHQQSNAKKDSNGNSSEKNSNYSVDRLPEQPPQQRQQQQQPAPSGKQTVVIQKDIRKIVSFRTSSSNKPSTNTRSAWLVTFPDICDCNSTLAIFGDKGDLLCALRLYLKMHNMTQIVLKLMISANSDVHAR